jgi:WXXGXW repeat (2 copies)
LPHPPYVRQPASALVAVPFPPPPGRVETVPKKPRNDAAWIDGEWTWRARRWLWIRGRWVTAPAGARYAAWALTRGPDGTVYVARGAWRDAAGHEIDAPAPLATADVSEGAVVDADGDVTAPGRTLPAPGEKGAQP